MKANDSIDDEYQKLQEEFQNLPDYDEEQQDTWLARRAMLGAMITNFCVGSYYAYGNVNPYIAYWLKEKTPWITTKNTLIIQPVWLTFQTVITTVGVTLAEKFGFRTTVFVSIFGYTCVNLLASISENFWVFIIVYGIGSGMFVGLGYLLSLYIAWTYYPNSKSIVTGLVLFATGLAPAVLSPLTTLIVNPGNDPVEDPAVYRRVPKMFRILAGIFGAALVLLLLVLPPPKKSLEMKRKKLMEKLGKHGPATKFGSATQYLRASQEVDNLNQFLQEKDESGEQALQNKKDQEIIDDIPMDEEDSPQKSLRAVDGDEEKEEVSPLNPDRKQLNKYKKSANKQPGPLLKLKSYNQSIGNEPVGESSDEYDPRRLTGSYRNSLAYLQSQKVFSQHLMASQSMVLFYGMSADLRSNLNNLHKEKQEYRRRTMGFDERRKMTQKQSQQAQETLKMLRSSLMEAKNKNTNIAEILPRATISKLVLEYADEMKPEEVEEIAEQLLETQCPDMKTGLNHPNFWLLVIMAIGSTIYNFFMNAAWKDLTQLKVKDINDSEMSLILTVAAIFEAFSGLVAGALLHYLPFKYFYACQVAVQILAVSTIWYLSSSYISITAYVSLSLYLLGSDKTVFPTITQQLFGPIAGPKIYPLIYVFFAVASFVQFIIYNFITHDFHEIFLIFTGCALASFIATLFLNMKPTWPKSSMENYQSLKNNNTRFMKTKIGEDTYDESSGLPYKQQNQLKKAGPEEPEGVPTPVVGENLIGNAIKEEDGDYSDDGGESGGEEKDLPEIEDEDDESLH